MLGRLLHLGTGSGASNSSQPHAAAGGPVFSLDSVHEDIHTRNLLFPDPETLAQNRGDQVFPLSTTPFAPPTPGTPTTFDSIDDIDLDVRDVRVLIMQDTLGHNNASMLFDSHPAPAPLSANTERPQTLRSDSRRTPTTSRKGSIGQPSRQPSMHQDGAQTRQGAFDRRGSLHGRSQSTMETETQKISREYRDELATFSSCIFGNSELMAYKGISTKVHVVPSETRSTEHPASYMGDGRSSLGRSSIRSSKLSQSYTSQAASLGTFSTNAPPSRFTQRKKVLITRLFPVNLTNEDMESTATPQSRFSDDNSSYPFPNGSEDATSRKKVPPKQRRTPMYAVVLVVQLPSARASAGATPKSAFRDSGSYTDQEVFPSSYGSVRHSVLNMTGSGTLGDAADSTFSVDVEDRIDSLTRHWDIITRTLTHLQSVVAATIKLLLKQADVSSPEPVATSIPPSIAPPRNQVLADRRNIDLSRTKPSKSTVKLVALSPNCLSGDMNIATEVNLARGRIVTGLKAARVVTGQGRWGIWRDEAIWSSKWTRSMDQGPFLYNLLTGFLATHTDWLQALSPPSLRRRYFDMRQHHDVEDLTLPSRTVVVADDKMAARRLIFLLSAFLPANQQLAAERPHRPSTSASIGGFSHSPPTYVVPVLREESLRRKINRRIGHPRASHSRNVSQSTRASAIPAQLAHLSMDHSHERRVSDSGSIRPSALTMPGNDLTSRKSSAATTATILPEQTMPHFSSAQRADNHRTPRPDSSGSLATDDLKRSLRRGESSSHASNTSADSRSQSSKWGSVISGLWSPRRRGSTSTSSPGQAADVRCAARPTPPRRDKLSEMVDEIVLMDQENYRTDPRPGAMGPREFAAPRERPARSRPSLIQADRPSDSAGTFESSVRTSINEDDGVIDVDFPFPDYITSFESAISSPSSSGYLSAPGLAGGLEAFEHSARVLADGDPPMNAAGWLNSFHPDFSLQAIPPQDDLWEQIKATLRSEPTPSTTMAAFQEDSPERWVDVGSVLLADTTTATVRRIVYKRLGKPRQPSERPAAGNHISGNQIAAIPHTPSTLPHETQFEEKFIEEDVLVADGFLVEAMEKVMNFGADDSKEEKLARGESQAESDSDHTLPERLPESGMLSTNPRVLCRTIVLAALEDLIRDVIDRKVDRSGPSNGHTASTHDGSLLQNAVRDWISNLDAGL